jgi:hypothetical protein
VRKTARRAFKIKMTAPGGTAPDGARRVVDGLARSYVTDSSNPRHGYHHSEPDIETEWA